MFSNSLIGSSNAFRSVIEDIEMVAPLGCAVLIQGETGTGKEVVARAVHDNGSRRNKPFVAVNCAAIPSALLESELFGHEKGAFTGAVSQSVGRFQAAHGGTLFLDEIGDLPLELQPKLLRVLQEQQFERVGSSRTTQVDVRIIAATNLQLQQMIDEKSFRADLYYRLSVFPIALPALRQRKEDIPLLVRYFVSRLNERLGRHVSQIPCELLELLAEYHWPGNIRELQNFVERAIITSPGDVLTPREKELRLIAVAPQIRAVVTLADAERAHIHRTLDETNWTIGGSNGAAARLGIPRTTLISRMEKLGFPKSPKRSEVEVKDVSNIFSPGSDNHSFALS
ncbi:AAA family ATPase [Granulicella sp. WH15]|uniref:sigma-54 interaction domain-containing protein n=1 Tax=Granulicella sp. WH15 TaxID=2602070 RepID=UPI001367435A|nr:sigma 54-interacting transcriptional regulator [Granulicella sp. WH15]QHN03634.1 AAA family ATPase [Granulicella sp. WH15]